MLNLAMPKMFTRTLLAFLMIGLSPLAAAGLKITATTGMLADMAQNIGGTHVEVTALMGPGIDPHLYKATAGDLRRLQQADLILHNGLHLEGKMAEVLEKLATRRPVYAVASALPAARLLEERGVADPHIWMDPALWRLAAEGLLAKISELDPAHAADYRRNAQGWFKRIDALDAWARKELGAIPERQRVLVTAHDAFRYFGRAYAVEVVGLQGISTATEFGLNDLGRVRELVLERGVKAIFVESSVSDKGVTALREGVAQSGGSLAIGGTLYSDAMGEPGTPEGTWIGMFEHNVRTIAEALR